jgi:hypothetical protein
MAAIGYLIRKSVKNWLRDIKNKPQLIILIIFVVVMLLTFVLGGNQASENKYDAALVSSIYFMITLIFGGVILYGGLSETKSFFRMADVNLMFSSPIKPAHVIVYGMIRNISSLAFAMLLMFYQIGTLRFSLGMTPMMIVWAFICVFLTLILCLTTSMCFMLLCSGRQRRQSLLKGLFIAGVAALLLYAIVAGKAQYGPSGMELFKAICSNRYLDFIPIFGWSRGLYVALISSSFIYVAIYGFLCLAILSVEVFAISHTKADYYEDVLDGASRKLQMTQAAKNGKRAFLYKGKDKTIRKFGINSGSGASVFMYKRMLERKRGTFGIFSFSTIFIIAAGIFMSFVLHIPYLVFLGTAAMFIIIFQRINSWEAELGKIYIFLAPSQPERKLFFAILPDLFTSLLDSAIVFAIGLALFGVGPFVAFVGSIAYFSICTLVTGSSVIIRRIFGVDTKNPLVQILAVYLPMIVMGIGVVPAVFAQLSFFADQPIPVIAILVITLWDILTAGLLLFLGKGVLSKGTVTAEA